MDRFPSVYYITVAGWYHLFIFAAMIPWLAWKSRRRVQDPSRPLPAPIKYFQSQTIMLAIFGALSLVTAERQDLDLFPRAWPSIWVALAGVLMYAVAVSAMRPYWRRAVEKKKRSVQLFMPDSPAERAWWVVVAVLAGISEEITWRGVQFALLTYLFGNPWIGALASAVMFGLGHIIQGWRSVLLISGFALAFQLLVALSGSLYVAMLVHAAYDITAGFTYGRFGRELKRRAGEALEQPTTSTFTA